MCTGRAFRNVSMFFRSQPDLVVEEQLVGMGECVREEGEGGEGREEDEGMNIVNRSFACVCAPCETCFLQGGEYGSIFSSWLIARTQK